MADDVLSLFQPAVSRWFVETFAEPTPPQVLGWPHIAAGENTLILSPTGSGKTLAAFLYAIDSVIRAENGTEKWVDGVHTLYLLMQTGVLTREILDRSNVGLTWRVAYPILTRMEWACDVDRAHFISVLSGPQFAPRGAVDTLSVSPRKDEIILLNVSDPANVYGDLFSILRSDGVRHIIRHHLGNYLVLENGHPILAVENLGERLISLSDLTPWQRRASFQTLTQLVEGRQRPTSIRALTYDGSPIVNSPIEEELANVGFVREDSGMILYRAFT